MMIEDTCKNTKVLANFAFVPMNSLAQYSIVQYCIVWYCVIDSHSDR